MPCYGAFPCGNLRGNELSHLHMWKIEENLCNSLPDLPTNFGRSKVSRVCACKEGIFVPKNQNFLLRASPADSFSQSQSFQEGVRKTHVFISASRISDTVDASENF